ncbi:Cro/CI family transcriptional regulator [Azorhizophilus paspali]|uniref:Cro/CI family transcriptional regulator n=1 Tax=Azorhizophilus paspali TaxID=69963 RepID=A0ABV6SHJ2_AZOPA
MNIYQSLIAHFGTQQKTADALRVDQGTVSGWVRGRHGMSPVTALKAEAVTQGKFKAVDLCPNLLKVAS